MTEFGPHSGCPEFRVALFTPTPNAAKRVLEFFTTQIENDNMRKAYMNARDGSRRCGATATRSGGLWTCGRSTSLLSSRISKTL
jgi:hypothetical protein